jgi:hypothetical protein
MDGVYYVESGTVKSGDGVHLIMSGGTTGGVLQSAGEGDGGETTIHPGLIVSEAAVVWTISRLLFQAVLIQHCKTHMKKKNRLFIYCTIAGSSVRKAA